MGYLNDTLEYIKSGETENNGLGLEIEHFVIDKDGFQIPFEEISGLIENVANAIKAKIVYIDGYPAGYVNDKYAISLEPSCQFEISISPYRNIADIEQAYNEFLSLWEPLFKERGYSIHAKGNLPLVECGGITPDDIPLSPKKRYRHMDAYFRESGKYGKYMMRASASTQVSVDYASEADLVRKLRVLQKISPILMIMMENKTRENSTLPNAKDKPHLLRIQEWDDLDPERTGFYPHSFEPGFGYQTIADVVCHTPLILLSDQGETRYVGHKNALDLVAEQIIPENVEDDRRQKLVEHFLSMGFFHFRIKKYIEIRVADSVPIKKALGYVALLKGIVYSNKNLLTLEKEFSKINDIHSIQEAVEQIEKDGLEAVVYGKTASEWISHLVSLAKESLPEHEKEYLGYV